jgi:multicomponent Na+:H+ antiporter subunit G
MTEPHPFILELLIAAAMLIGTFLIVVACIGLVRFPDIYTRMHAAGKAGTLGMSTLILAAMLFFFLHDVSVVLRGVLAIFFQFLTTPAATHILSRASYITGYPQHERTAVDELRTHLPALPDETYGHE